MTDSNVANLCPSDLLRFQIGYTRYTATTPDGMTDYIPVERFNSFYSFYDLWDNPASIRDYISNPNCLVVKIDARLLVFCFRYLTLKDLRLLCRCHNLLHRRDSKAILISALTSHDCSPGCARFFYVFKILAHPRVGVESKFSSVSFSVSSNSLSEPLQSLESLNISDVRRCDVSIAEDESVNANMVASSSVDHLSPINDGLRLSIIEDWQRSTAMDVVRIVVCAACSRKVITEMSEWIDGYSIDFVLLRNVHLPEILLPTTYDTVVYRRALLNPKGLERTNSIGSIRLCLECVGSLRAGFMPKYALANWLYYGVDLLPPDVRKVFDDSTLFERKMICRARYNSICCKFGIKTSPPDGSRDNQLAQARRGIRGNVMVAPLDVIRLNTLLPPNIEIIRDTLCAVFVSDRLPTRATIERCKPILVRKSRVKKLIEFLLGSNPFYQPINGFGFCQQRLDTLSEGREHDDYVLSVHIGHIPLNDAIDGSTADYTPRNIDGGPNNSDENELLMENVGYTQGDSSTHSYQAMKMTALEHCLRGDPFLVSGTGTGLVRDFENPSILSWLFPHLDPWGIGGFHHPARTTRLSMQEQLSYLLLVDQSPFERDPEFAFVFYNIIRKATVSRGLRFGVSAKSHQLIVRNLLNIDPEVLAGLRDKCQLNPAYKPLTDKESQVFRVLSSLRVTARHFPGSDGYKLGRRNEIRSIINAVGAPTLFITLNPSDVDHPLVRIFAGEDIVLDDVVRGEDVSSWGRRLFAAANPSSCALFFHFMITRFIVKILRYGRDIPGLYGICQAYYAMVEAQGKGTLHCHMLVWLAGHLSPERLREEMNASLEYRDRVFKWVESIIQCEFPGATSVKQQLEAHPTRIRHTDLGNPHPGVLIPPFAVTDPADFFAGFSDSVTQLLHEYNWHKHQPTCWKYLTKGDDKNDKNCRLGMNGETRESTGVDAETSAIQLRRLHPMIAAHTDVVTFLLRCNMDIKFIGSGEAAQSFLYYVTDYVTKPSLPVHVGMAALVYSLKVAYDRIPDPAAPASDQQATSIITTAVNSMLARQEISHPQVMSYLVGGGDHYTSESFSLLYWSAFKRFSDEEWTALEGHDGPDSGISNQLEETVSISLSHLSITVNSQLMDYIYRSSHEDFDHLCLYEFVAVTLKLRLPAGRASTLAPRPGSFGSEYHPQNFTHYLILRDKKVIPVLLGPSIPNPKRSPEAKEQWARDMLLLFRPWRSSLTLRAVNSTWLSAYEESVQHIPDAHRKIIANMNVLSESSDARDANPRFRVTSDTSEDPYSQIKAPTFNEGDLLIIEQEDGSDNLDDHDENSVFLRWRTDAALDAAISRQLDMCFMPITGDVEGNGNIGEPICATLTSVTDKIRISEHARIMTGKRKRLIVDAGEDERVNQRAAPLHQIAPIAVQASLQDGTWRASRRVRWAEVAETVVDEMNLRGNAEQLRSCSIVAEHVIEGSSEQLLLYVSGVGGTGKSHLINSIVSLFERLGIRNQLALGAPTGIAAVLIGGQTLHSLILATPTGRSKDMTTLCFMWRGKRYLIVDEVSMLGACFMSQLSSRLQQAKGDDVVNSHKPFGGLNVLFFGDFGQLKPPKQYSLYSHELVKNPSFAQSKDAKGVSAMHGAFLWRSVSKVVALTRNQRHASDPAYAAFLGRLRLGHCLSDVRGAVAKTDLDYLRTRVLCNVVHDVAELALFKDAPVIVGNKALRDHLNHKLLLHHAQRLNTDVRIYYSVDTSHRAAVPRNAQEALWDLPSSVNQEAFGRLALFVGMKVMVTENIAFDDKIVNGSEGVITEIKYDEICGRRHATVVYVHVPNCGMSVAGIGMDVVPVFPVSTSIDHPCLRSTALNAKSFTRKQLPLVPAYAYTDFKSQGRTLDRAIVDLCTARGQGIYVMLSRVKTLRGLLILRWFPPNKVYHRLPQELREELDRLDMLNSETSR